MPADLHLHSYYSDGTFSPEEIARRAEAAGLDTIALTDHDTLLGCRETAEACRRRGIRFIPGSELTVEWDGWEVHVLGYFLDAGYEPLRMALARFQRVRQERLSGMVERINQCGVPLGLESIHASAQCRAPGRPHVARALVEEGFCASYDEAFDRFLRRDRPAWIPKCRISVEQTLELIHAAGGVAVMAHPGLNQIDAAIPVLREMGLDGLECYHSRHRPAQVTHYLALAKENGLGVTGGSDCHGFSKKKPLIGSVAFPRHHFEHFLEAYRLRSAAASPAVPSIPKD